MVAAPQPSAPVKEPALYKYAAFISYKRDSDLKIATALQSALYSIAKPWYRLRALRVFRDKTDLAISNKLWTSIQQALENSEYLILLASPPAAASPWVLRELEYWIGNRSSEKLLLVLTDGEIVWDNRIRDFNWSQTNSLPVMLRGVFKEEPLYVDLRWTRNTDAISSRHPEFRDAAAQIAAHIQGREKSEIIGEDVRQYRRSIRLAWLAIITLLVLTLAAGGAAWYAYQQRNVAEARRQDAENQRNEAERQKKIAQEQTRIATKAAEMERRAREEAVRQRDLAFVRQLASRAELLRAQNPVLSSRSILLAIETLRRAPSLEAEQTLRDGLALLPRAMARLSHRGSVNAVAFSPDGERLATAGSSGLARIFKVNRAREIRFFKLDRGSPPVAYQIVEEAIAFSPDGGRLATASPFTVQVWDTDSGHEIAALRHEREVHALTFSPDGAHLATAGGDRTARILDIARRREWKHFEHEGNAAVTAVAFSPGGKYLATTDATRILRIWDVAAEREVGRYRNESVSPIALSRDGKYFAEAHSGVIEICEVARGREIAHLKQEPLTGPIMFGGYPATATANGATAVWALKKGPVITRLMHREYVVAATFSPDGNQLATAGRDGVARIWELPDGREASRIVHDDEIVAIAYSPNGKYLATAGKDGVAAVWEAAGMQDVVRRVSYEGSKYTSVFSLDGRYLAAPRADGSAILYDTSHFSLKHLKHGRSIRAVGFSPDNKFLITADAEGAVRLWTVSNGREVAHFTLNVEPTGVALSPGATHIITLDKYGAGRVWEANRGREIARLPQKRPMMDVVFSPEGKYVATAGQDATARVWTHWNTASPQEVTRLEHERTVLNVDFSPDGRFLATGAANGEARVIEIPTRREVMRVKHEDAIVRAAFAPDGKYLATASLDGTARVWEIPVGREVVRLRHERGPEAVAFISAGERLATTSRDHIARVWRWRLEDLIDEACARLARNLATAEWRDYLGDAPYRKTCPNLP